MDSRAEGPEHPAIPLIPAPSPLDRALEALDRARGHPGLATGAAVIALVVLVLVWRFVAPNRTPLEDTLPFASIPPAATMPIAAKPDVVAVHAAGAVRNPGLYLVEPGSRVAALIDLAGGAIEDADLSRVNLAAVVVDATQVYVPIVGESAPLVASGDEDGDGPVNVNTASAGQLENLPGLGPSLSQAIVDHRDEAGPFASLDALLQVSGIGPAKLARIRDLAVVS